ncbi:MAG: site-specific integrase [Actinomycetota bacterium]|nr:site-specific integrase [Actinomycetota bacterium]
MGKRTRGYGAVYHRPDGRWEGQIRIPGGRRQSFYARTRRDVIHRLSEARWALGQGLPVSAGTTSLETYFGRWLALTASRLRPSTVRAYRLDAQRLLPYLGQVPLRSLMPGMIVSTYASLMESGLSARSVEQTHCVLHLALKQAMHWGIIGRNPSELVTPPRPRTREMTALNRCQLQHLLSATAGSRWHTLWVLLGTTGMRLGESLGLKWDDVDLQQGRLVVRRTLLRHPGRGLIFAPPKTEKSRRTIYLSGVARRSLLHHRQGEPERRAQAVDWREYGLVFTNLRGGPVESGEINRTLTRCLQRVGLPHIRVHDLRHTVASILLESGVHPKIVQELLGHSTIRLTLDTYSHLTPALHQEAARTMDRVIAGTPVG